MPKIEKTQVVCVAEFRAKEGKTDELIAAMHPLMQPTHKEAGCIRYELNQRTDDPRWGLGTCGVSPVFSQASMRGAHRGNHASASSSS